MKRILRLFVATIISLIAWALATAIVSPVLSSTSLLNGDYKAIGSSFLSMLPAALVFVRLFSKKEKRTLYYRVVAISMSALIVIQIPVFLAFPLERVETIRSVNLLLMIAVFMLAKRYISRHQDE